MGRQGASLAPGSRCPQNHLGTWAKDPVKITRGFDVLWVYGYIKYGDAFGFVRRLGIAIGGFTRLKGIKLPALLQVGRSPITTQHKARIQLGHCPFRALSSQLVL